MIHTAEIYMWGSRIGIVHQDDGVPYVTFEYDREFQKSGIELSPIFMPLAPRIYQFPELADAAFHGTPGLLSDSLPDRFGNAVISQWLTDRGMRESDFSVIDRLCYTGSRGMGALEYVPATGPGSEIKDAVNVSEMVKFASEILNNRGKKKLKISDNLTYSQLLQLGTSAGGARAKAVIAWNEAANEIRSGQINAGDGYDYWLIKFDNVERNGDHGTIDEPEYTLIEYAYYRMALQAGIEMNECRILKDQGAHHFMTKRFDRVDGKKLHMQTLGALAHINYNIPGLCSYEQAASYMKQIGLPAVEIEQFFRRLVFNVFAVNQDDHVKNVSFLMDKRGVWRLAPAYDLTFSYNPENRWLSAHQMTINGKKENITVQDLFACGQKMDISSVRMKRIIADVQNAVSNWKTIAEEVGICEKTADMIESVNGDGSH